ncbi:M56 family metallopeptidase [Mucilaginibacter sp. BJC16-A38]|uniref:M56 family metallopeptidase n=1 Tax=Mucilaginibacter phenanthrenivorans TaxID=1234842 RepID=UPI00215863AB|nr:M56 family metallopeptidase [Mucilaginibacter phenanthrenivorans]MCR8556448.1 M56 family metallopeptidase [Mucilaginibacter phenanthrenivorans]
MIAYLVNSTLCSALLLAVYHLLLKNKTMYNFNRVYLLLSVVFSLTVPLIVVKHTIVRLPSIQKTIEPQLQLTDANNPQPDFQVQTPLRVTPIVNHPHINYLPGILMAVYGIVSLLLLFRFIRNLNRIRLTIKQNQHVTYKDTKLILVNENLTPHTFLRYIFLNRQQYESNQIEADILKHEQTHASQLHSVDIIFMELITCFCWFNPLVWFYRNAIQLNHEFIADTAVVTTNCNISEYQQLLLGKLGYMKSLSITSQFNYSITKNRLIMMNKNTSALTAALSKLAVIPVLAFAFTFFCTKTEAQQTPAVTKQDVKAKPESSTAVKPNQPVRKVSFPPPMIWGKFPHTKEGVSADSLKEYAVLTAKFIDTNNKFIKRLGTISKEDKKRMKDIFEKMSPEQQMQQKIGFSYPAPPLPRAVPTQAQLDSWKNPAEFGVWINEKKAKNADLEKYKAEDFNQYFVSKLYPAARVHVKYHYQVDLMTVDFYNKYRKEALENKTNAYTYYRSWKPEGK